MHVFRAFLNSVCLCFGHICYAKRVTIIMRDALAIDKTPSQMLSNQSTISEERKNILADSSNDRNYTKFEIFFIIYFVRLSID